MKLSEFKSDGCTGWFNFKHEVCCIRHDFADYIGLPDAVADLHMYDCVLGFSGILMALTMYLGVKLFRPTWRFIKGLRAR